MLLCPELTPAGSRVTNSELTPLGSRGYTELMPAGSIALSPKLAPSGGVACSKLTPTDSRGTLNLRLQAVLYYPLNLYLEAAEL